MTRRERDEETGRFTDKYPPEDILEAIRDLGDMAATSEIAEGIGASRGTAYKKLQFMEGDGQVTSRKAGGSRVWSVAEEETGVVMGAGVSRRRRWARSRSGARLPLPLLLTLMLFSP